MYVDVFVSFMSGDSGSNLLPYYRTVLSLQGKSRKEKTVLGRISVYESQEEDVNVSGFV